MKKLYLSLFLFFSVVFVNNTYAQVPVVNYGGQGGIYPVGIAIKPITPVSTGGAVPALIYSKVTTIAGTGRYGNKDTLAAYSTFEGPNNVALDKAGNIYVADANLNQIRKISTTGLVTIIAGSVKGDTGRFNAKDTLARFNYPTGIAVDALNNIYVADTGNSLIREILTDGTVITFAGNYNFGSNNGTGTAAQFSFPHGITFDKNGNLLVADSYNNRIRKITPAGVVTSIAGTGAIGLTDGNTSTATFNVPNGITTDNAGNIYVAELGNKAIRKISPAGITSTFATIPDSAISVAVDNQNQVYVTGLHTYHIIKFDPTGAEIVGPYKYFSGGNTKKTVDGTDTLTKYVGNMGLLLDGTDNLLIADPGGDKIRKIAINGFYTYPHLPAGLVIDSTGVISGTPTTIQPSTRYDVYAYNSSGANTGTASFFIGVGTGSQAITFDPLPAKTFGAAKFKLTATSTDTLHTNPITYTSTNLAVATIVSADSVRIVGAGTATIIANQAANGNYFAAPAISQILTVNPDTVKVIANSLTRTAGDNNPALSVYYQGFLTVKDSLSMSSPATATTTATPGSPVGSYPIMGSGAVAANYTFKYIPGVLTVFPVPKISVSGLPSILKGDSILLTASPGTGYFYQWQLNGVDITGATNATYYAKQTGYYSIYITNNGYTTYSTTNIYITAGRVITFNPMPAKTYGDSDFQPVISSLDSANAVTFTSSNPAVATIEYNLIHIVGIGTTTITANQAGNSFYSAAAPVSQVLTVNPATVTVTANSISKTAGASNPLLSLYYQGFVNGQDTTVLKTKATITTTATVSSPGGVYPITASGATADNYVFNYVSASLTVVPIPTIAVTGPLSITAGDSVLMTATPSAGYTYQWQLNGVNIAGATNAVYYAKQTGYYTVSVTNNNYTTYSAAGTNITSAQKITFNPPPAKNYGDANFKPVTSTLDSVNTVTFTSSNLSVATVVGGFINIVGVGSTTITANQAGNSFYAAAAPVSQILTVNPAMVTVIVNSISKTSGTSNPALSLYYQGFVNGQDTTILKTKAIITTTATTSSPGGVYPITASGATADNYIFTYVAGSLTVVPIPTIAVTGSLNILVGDSVLMAASPAAGYSYKWQLNGVNIAGATNSTYYGKQSGAYTVSITANAYTTYSAATTVLAQLALPASNFSIKINSATCKGSNNGSIFISAAQKENYSAVFTGNNINKTYNYTDTLTIASLPPGTYNVCMTVSGQIFSQCFQVNVTEPQDLSVYSVVNLSLRSINLQLSGGNLYNIAVNDKIYSTTASQITLPLLTNVNKITVTTDRLCQGIIEKTVDLTGNITPYPNPFKSLLNVNIGNQTVGNIQVNIVSLLDGKSVYTNQYTNQAGVLEFDLSNLSDGYYYLNLNLDNQKSGYKIIKK